MMTREQKLWLAGLLLADVVASLICLAILPSTVPAHWNSRGQIDRYGSPWESTLLVSVCIVLFPGFLVALPRIARVGAALNRSQTIYGRMVLAVTAALVAMHLVIMLCVREQSLQFLAAVPILFGALWMVIGNWMGKIRRNSIMGIRTPWTLKSDTVWERTHRVGGRLQVAHGLATVLAGILLPAWAAFFVLTGGLVALVIWALAYSWWITPRPHADQPFA
jgi:uncharacterized membrane protein